MVHREAGRFTGKRIHREIMRTREIIEIIEEYFHKPRVESVILMSPCD